MIRIVIICSLALTLSLALYLPSRYPAERFLHHLRTEHRFDTEYWGEPVGLRIIDRVATVLEVATVNGTPTDNAAFAGKPTGVAMTEASQRLIGSSYFRSLEALFALATYRTFSLLEWLPWLVPLGLALVLDGAAARTIRSKEFVQHDPEFFALFICTAAILAAALLAGLLVPVTLDPLVAPAVIVALLAALSRALASFHRSG
ncbi:DUF4400 domain-containing protein [Piscinibacter sakaiensis]|uniref:DUF4400 domain-containing protein n=1 Tax=Piscinibacter sakaiensis TaxID=1547922 RepID=UPI003AB06EF3